MHTLLEGLESSIKGSAPGRRQSQHLNHLVNQIVLFDLLLQMCMPGKVLL